MARPPRPELAPFLELNQLEKKTGKKRPEERSRMIREQFPSVDRLDWAEAFKDTELYLKIWMDILSDDQKEAYGGTRKPLDPERAKERLRQLMGQDFSCENFAESLAFLAGDRSIRQLARKIGLSATRTYELKTGTRLPDLYEMETIAAAFNKHPSYFVEYRVEYIAAAMVQHMLKSPETSIDAYKRLRRKS